VGSSSSLFDVIDLRSFSTIWYWIGLAVLWSTAAQWVLGVPYSMVVAARRHGGRAMQDLRVMTRINVERYTDTAQSAGLWLVAIVVFLLTVLGVTGFGYGSQFAQALFLLGFPYFFVVLLNHATARRIRADQPDGEALCRSLSRCRAQGQVIGFVSIFVTALWGMYQNLSLSVLGG